MTVVTDDIRDGDKSDDGKGDDCTGLFVVVTLVSPVIHSFIDP